MSVCVGVGFGAFPQKYFLVQNVCRCGSNAFLAVVLRINFGS